MSSAELSAVRNVVLFVQFAFGYEKTTGMRKMQQVKILKNPVCFFTNSRECYCEVMFGTMST